MERLRRYLGWMVVVSLLCAVVPGLVWAAEDVPFDWTEELDPSTAITYIWLILMGALVFFMQAGFAMVEAGFSRSKNVANVLMKNLMDFSLGILAFWAVGYALMWGSESNLFIGYSDFFLRGFDSGGYNSWFFQMVFAATAATIVSGAMAERTRFHAYLIYTVIVTALIYPIYNHAVWSGNGVFWVDGGTSFLTKMFGVDGHDFAGSGVVHAVGGYVALAGAMLVGPRTGKYNPDGSPNAIPGHSLALAALGTLILAFGWIGFNGGSTLSGTDSNFNLVIVNTMLSAGAGAVAVMIVSWKCEGKPDPGMTMNGLLAGLVGITAPCGSVQTWAAVVIGLISGVVVYYGVLFNERTLKVDDPVGAIAVHGYTGTWGVISVGIFSDGIQKTYAANVPGLLYGGFPLFGIQIVMALVNFLFAFGAGYLTFWIIRKTVGLRATPEEELKGMDLAEHNAECYPERIF